jgi:hypothetical protein
MYSPRIDEKLIPELYRLKQTTRKPMTKMVNEAVVEYLQKCKEKNESPPLADTKENSLKKGENRYELFRRTLGRGRTKRRRTY